MATERSANYSSLDMHEALIPYFSTPEQHFFAFEAHQATFFRMDRAAYHRSIFLDRRIAALDPALSAFPLAPLINAAQSFEAPSIGWIFHIAHCGSTLLARLIDQPQGALVLREPPPLRQLGISRASGTASADWSARLRLAHAMVARRFDKSWPTIVKANVPVNFIMPQLRELENQAPAILLYFTLEPYLLAVLRTPIHRAWVDRLTMQLGLGLEAAVGLRPTAGTAERAAALWLAQMLMFDRSLHANPAARSLDAEALFTSPTSVADLAAHHFAIPADERDGKDEQLTSRYSKDSSKPFDDAARRARQESDRASLRHDLQTAWRWIEKAAAARNLPRHFERPLSGTTPDLLERQG